MNETQVMQMLPEFGLAVVSLLFIYCIGVDMRIRANSRLSDVSHATKLLSEHYNALEKFVDDAAAPEELKDVLLQFSDAAADKEVALYVAREYAMGSSNSKKDDNSSVVALEELHHHRPDLEQLFIRSVGTGMLAMYYRWPETAKYRDSMMQRIASGRTSEVSFAARSAKRWKGDRHNDDSNVGGDLAIA